MVLSLCILHIFLVLNIAYVSQQYLKYLLRKYLITLNYLEEAIATFAYSSCVFEIGVINSECGVIVALCAGFLILLGKNGKFLFQGRAANPCGLMYDLLQSLKLKDFLMLTLMQLSGAFLSYFYISLMWKLTQSSQHFQQLEYSWKLELKTGIVFSVLKEFFATFICNFVDLVTRQENMKSVNPVINTATSVLVSYLLADSTGIWMNPTLASVHLFQFRKKLLQNIIVFWFAPIFGTIFAYNLAIYVLNTVVKHRIKKEL